MSKRRPPVSWVDPTTYRSGAEWIKSTQQSRVPRDGEFIHAEWSLWREPPRHGAFGPSTAERHFSWCGVRLRLILADMFDPKLKRACPACLSWMKRGTQARRRRAARRTVGLRDSQISVAHAELIGDAGGVHILNRPDRFPRSSRYDPDWLFALDMGPHPLWQLEDLLPDLRLSPGHRVLDLGCGRGATAVFLAREANVVVSAFDRWVDEGDLRTVVDAADFAHRISVSVGDVRHLPFGDAEFDAIVSVDAFEYFGTDVHLLPALLRVLKPGGRIAISTPALKVDPYLRAPPKQVTALAGWQAAAWHAPDWWRQHWELTGLVEAVTARMQPASRDDWMLWARATGAGDGDPLLTMLASVKPDDIGFALVSAVKAQA